ncbi:hypothetical protein [Cyclobacterium jeungdonense]|uniref:Uncharacterized protein n=1 Tax=Cyclobacterium jeungdonense TaxID=708087 RepID=A0ABT8C4M6_9BACT|nr:hypothetical protein [Cyclobacterium jeungdonense]MDN3686701.1 hypothetical protein [Cyclobacterium jeungdonense]
MKKIRKKRPSTEKSVLAKLNDNPDKNEKGGASNKKKGIISKMNDNPDKKNGVS